MDIYLLMYLVYFVSTVLIKTGYKKIMVDDLTSVAQDLLHYFDTRDGTALITALLFNLTTKKQTS